MKVVRKCLYIFIMLPCLVMAQPEVDYANKTLVKKLEKEGIDLQQLQEIPLSDPEAFAAGPGGKFFVTGSTNVSQLHYIFVGRVNSCRSGGCSVAGNSGTNMSSEYFDYFILFDNKAEINLVHVFNYRATHGYEICSRGWLKQFSGYNGSGQLEVGKTIDGISGATKSVHAITSDVRRRTNQLQEILATN